MTYAPAFCHLCGKWIGGVEYTNMFFKYMLMHPICDKCFQDKGLKEVEPLCV